MARSMRRHLPAYVCAMLLAVAASVPRSAGAQQIGFEQPLAIYCLSYAQDYCLSFLSWETRLHEGTVYSSVTAKVQLYGEAVSASPGQFVVSMYSGCSDGFNSVQSAFDGAGYFLVNDNPVCAPTGTVADFARMDFILPDESGNRVLGCSVEAECVRVPEPGTGLLLASGLFGVALMARWRPRVNPRQIS